MVSSFASSWDNRDVCTTWCEPGASYCRPNRTTMPKQTLPRGYSTRDWESEGSSSHSTIRLCTYVAKQHLRRTRMMITRSWLSRSAAIMAQYLPTLGRVTRLILPEDLKYITLQSVKTKSPQYYARYRTHESFPTLCDNEKGCKDKQFGMKTPASFKYHEKRYCAKAVRLELSKSQSTG